MDSALVIATLAAVMGAVVASVVQAVTMRQLERAERALVEALRRDLDATKLAYLRDAMASARTGGDRSTYEQLAQQYVKVALGRLREDDQRRVREGVDQPSAVERLHYAQKILTESIATPREEGGALASAR